MDVTSFNSVAYIFTGLAVCLVLYLLQKGSSELSQSSSQSDSKRFSKTFNYLRKEANWDFSKEMLWGYFFTDPDRSKLESFAQLLEKKGYKTVQVYPMDAGDHWWLHVERIETHTANSFSSRQQELSELSESAEIEAYDGWDVGEVREPHN